MSLSRETALELMALADGELDDDAAAKARAESWVVESVEARRFVDSTHRGEVGAFLQSDLDRRATASGADAIVDSVIARIQVEWGRAPVLTLRRHAPRSERTQGRLVVASVCTGVALAAGVALYFGRQARVEEVAPVATIDRAPPPVSGGPSSLAYGVEVDEIDSPAHDISLFEITGNAAAAANPGHPPSVVIWVEDGTGPK